MGLLLSVLVACVGVVELFAFYANVSRNFISASAQTNLVNISRKYFEDLEQQRKELQSQIPNGNCLGDHGVTTITAKDVVTEYLHVIETRSRSPSPRKLFSRTKETTNIPKSSSLQTSVVTTTESEELHTFNHTVKREESSQNCVTKNDDKTEVLRPLPKQGSEIEEDLTILEVSKPRSRSPSPISFQLGEQDVAFRRSPSPYPSLVLAVPRNSISNELLENATVSVAEVDEESISRSPTPEKIHMILESKHNSIEYWTNKVLVVPPTKPNKKSENTHPFSCSLKSEESSSLESSISQTKERTERPTLESILSHDSEISTKDDDEIENEIKEYDAQFLDSVDGVKKKKLSRSSSSRRSRKKRTPNLPVDSDPKDDYLSSSSMQNNDAHTAKTLTEAANVLKTVNSEAGGPSVSTSGSKDCKTEEPEPFWLIFSGEYTKAMNKDWHGQHFCCWQCDESLTGQRYVLRDEHPYCVSCYESVFANACEKCSRTIGIDSKDLSYKDKHWHEACFLCTTCGESLVDRQFGSKGDRIYCGRCYDEQFASRCDGCHEIFRAGTKKMEYKTRQWHEKCFCCCVCKVPIGTQSFIPREQEIYCAKCYEEKFATRCIKCNKVITSGGVTYKNEPWHRECFTCTHCSKSLAGERFTSRDEKPYCAECFGELFAKRCFACNKPITGIGGTKFISFEDRHWHNDCFFCASCRTSLVGRGFITDQDDIICPECAKQKLM